MRFTDTAKPILRHPLTLLAVAFLNIALISILIIFKYPLLAILLGSVLLIVDGYTLAPIFLRSKRKAHPPILNFKHQSCPPRFGEYIFSRLLPKEDAESSIGDLFEEYHEITAKFGERRARLWYYRQVISSIVPLVRRTIMKGFAKQPNQSSREGESKKLN